MHKTKGGILIPSYLGAARSLAGAAGTTRLVDAFVPELFESYSVNDTTELTAFADSGVLRSSDQINQMVQHGGATITIPHWNDIDASEEPNYSQDDPDKHSTPDKIDSGEQIARVAFLNNSWSAADLVKELAGSDPNQRLANRIDYYWARQWQLRVLKTCIGLYNQNVAQGKGDMVIDASKYTDVGEQVFNVNNFVDAQFTMGDHVGNMNVIAMHSMVLRRITKNNEVEDIRDSEGNLLYKVYKGSRIIVDDGMPTFGSGAERTYLSILFGAGALTYGYGSPRVSSEVDRSPSGGKGGGIETMFSRKTWLIHPTGYQFTSKKLSGNGADDAGTTVKQANWADLQDATNWKREFDRKKVRLAFLITRG
ncbi:major capsid protein [Providencia phage Kokobel2]|nr:major capsid protein [Providencia phage Kokobel2]